MRPDQEQLLGGCWPEAEIEKQQPELLRQTARLLPASCRALDHLPLNGPEPGKGSELQGKIKAFGQESRYRTSFRQQAA